MYNNERYYLEKLDRAIEEAESDLSEGGSDFLHVTLDALRHLEGAIKEGFRPWEAYNEPMGCYRVTAVSGQYTDIWMGSLLEAVEKFKTDFPALEVASAVRQY